MEFTRQNIPAIIAECNAALEQIGKKHGISLTVTAKSFGPTDIHGQFSAIANTDGTQEAKAKADFEKYAAVFGLKPTDFGRSFRDRASVYTIVGINPAAPAYPIQVKNQNGKGYKYSATSVRLKLG